MITAEQAEKIARDAHMNQTCKFTGRPYVEHLERVVAQVEGDEAKAVAWLHDTVEDTDVELRDLWKAGLSDPQFEAIRLLTRKKDEPYSKYIVAIIHSGNEIALDVKTADVRDHLRGDGPMIPDSMWNRYSLALTALDSFGTLLREAR